MIEFHANPPIHPGEVLREEFMVPLGLTPGKIARAIGVPRTRIERLANEQTGLTADTAIRLARYFKMSEGFWLGLQKSYEVDVVHADAERIAGINAIVPLPRPDLGDIAA
jgi:addiction module HigA family antidote